MFSTDQGYFEPPCRLVQRTKSPNPSLRLQAIVEEILQAYIFPRADSAHKHHQIEPIVICTENLPKRFVHDGFGKC